MIKTIFSAIFIIFVLCKTLDASVCQPLSVFKVDCNVCMCNQNGFEFTCTKRMCPPPKYSEFIERQTKDGYKVLTPKASFKFDPPDDFQFSPEEISLVAQRNVRQPRIIPYGDDGLSRSDENQVEDQENNDIVNVDEYKDAEYVNSDFEEARQANEDYDNGFNLYNFNK